MALVSTLSKAFSQPTKKDERQSVLPADFYDPRNRLDVVHAAVSFAESSLFLGLGFIQCPRYASEDNLRKKLVKHTQQAYWTVVPKILPFALLEKKDGF